MTTPGSSDKPTRHRVALVLLLICALGISLRVYHALTAVAISPDSALFIEYARRLAEDPLASFKEYQQHPLYPALILLFHQPVGWVTGDGSAGWIHAGRLAAIVGSIGAILALYWFAARLYDRTCGLIAAALIAVLPDGCRYGADVLTDLPHLTLYLVGLTALLAGMQTERWRYLLIAAAASALAFLTRPEGGSVLLVGLVVVLLHRAWRFRRRAALVAAMVATFFCVVGPYQVATGRLVQKKSLLGLFKFGLAANVDSSGSTTGRSDPLLPPPQPNATCPGRATSLPVPIDVLRQWVRAGRVVYIVLAIVGVVVARPRGVGGRVLGAAIAVHLLLLHALEAAHGYLDRRHALILATLSLPLAAQGIWWLADKLSTRAAASRSAWRSRIVVGTIALCVLGTSRWLLRPINAADKHVVASARWLARHSPPAALVVGDNRLRRVALYADRSFAEWPWWGGSVKHLAEFLDKGRRAAYFVVDVRHMTRPERNPAFFEHLRRQFGDQLKLLHTEPAPQSAQPTEIRIYRYDTEGRAPRPS